jgi:hypothetical protein
MDLATIPEHLELQTKVMRAEMDLVLATHGQAAAGVVQVRSELLG